MVTDSLGRDLREARKRSGMPFHKFARLAGFSESHLRSAENGHRAVTRQIAGRLHGNIGFTELNIHSLHTLIRVRPALAQPVAADLQATITRLLDEDQVSAPARRELETLRYGIAIARQT